MCRFLFQRSSSLTWRATSSDAIAGIEPQRDRHREACWYGEERHGRQYKGGQDRSCRGPPEELPPEAGKDCERDSVLGNDVHESDKGFRVVSH